MGQYYTISAPETGTGLNPFTLGAMLKMAEQIYNDGPKMALAILCADGFGDHPRDLPWAQKSQWAGKMLMATGDYAEQGDLIGREDRLEKLKAGTYGTAKEADLYTRLAPRKNLLSLSEALMPIIERAANVRFSSKNENGTPINRYCDMIKVIKTENGWDFDTSDYSPSEKQDYLDYLDRMTKGQTQHLKRKALPIIKGPDDIPNAGDNPGQSALWVSLDRMEYIDCAQMNERDLPEIVKGESARTVLSMLFHHERRGGGDLPDYGPTDTLGRWRGDRIVLLGENGAKIGRKTITQDHVRSTMRDITNLAIAQAYINNNGPELREAKEGNYTPSDHDKAIMDTILKACFQEECVAQAIQNNGTLRAQLRLPVKSQTMPTIPASFALYTSDGGGRYWLSEKTMAKINPLLETLNSVPFEEGIESNYPYHVNNNRYEIEFNPQSAHERLELLHDLQNVA